MKFIKKSECFKNDIINERKLNGGNFDDFDFKIHGDILKELVISYILKPNQDMIKKDLEIIKKNYKEGSVYNDFEPKLGIIYPFVYGWTSGWNAFLTTEENSNWENEKFPDEPSGEYAPKSKRKVFKF